MFTEAEKSDLNRLIAANDNLLSGARRAALFLENPRSMSDRPRMVAVLSSFQDMTHRLSHAMRDLYSDIDSDGTHPDRVGAVASAYSGMDNVLAQIAALPGIVGEWADDDPDGTASQLGVALDYADRARVDLSDMDRTLVYTDWRPESYPRVIGPHGDYDASLSAFNGSQLYLHRMMAAALRFFERVSVWPVEANAPLQDVVSSWAKVAHNFQRSRGLDAEVVNDADQALIQSDVDASTGLRPFDFFRVLVEIEYVFSDGRAGATPLHTGRLPQDGLQGDIFGAQASFTEVVYQTSKVNTGEEMSGHFQLTNDGTIASFYIDVMDFWSRMDQLAQAWMGFYHDIPSAPPVDGPGNGDPDPDPVVHKPVLTVDDDGTVRAHCEKEA